jgi:hypothetical protein
MPPPRDILPIRTRRQRLAPMAALAALAVAGAAGASTPGAQAYYERALMHAADARCHLFAPALGSALAAAEAQARGAALRAGATNAALRVVQAQAIAKQAGLACGAHDLGVAAARVKTAFDGYSKLIRMSFPGDDAGWQADRTLPLRTPIWRLSQPASAGPVRVMFGLAGDYGHPAQLLAVGDFGPGETPYAAQLMVRDTARAPEPYLQAVSVAAWARLPLAERAPPRSAALAFTAEARAAADKTLLPRGAASGIAFRFPAAAAQALAGLDPREAVTLVFLIQDASGATARRAYVEVGDFAAGQAFLAAAPR